MSDNKNIIHENWDELSSILTMARKFYIEDKFLDSVQLFEKLLNNNNLESEQRAIFLMELAFCHTELNGHELSIKYLLEAEKIGLNPEYRCKLYRVLGMNYFSISDYSSSLKYRKKALKLSKNKSEENVLLYEIGRNYHFMKDYKNAIKYYKKCLNKLPEKSIDDKIDAIYNIGFAYLSTNKIEEAKDTFTSLIDNSSDITVKIKGYYGLTKIYYKLDMLDKVKELTEKIIRYHENFDKLEEIKFYRIMAYASEENIIRAMDLIKKFLKDYPNSKYLEEIKNMSDN